MLAIFGLALVIVIALFFYFLQQEVDKKKPRGKWLDKEHNRIELKEFDNLGQLKIPDLIPETKAINANYWHKKPLTNIEQVAYWKIKEAISEEKVLLAQVGFTSFIRTKGDKNDKFTLWAEMRQKVADFVICNKDFSIHCIIEIDDKTHDIEKDEKRDKALNEAGIRTVRFRASNLPSVEEIKETIK